MNPHFIKCGDSHLSMIILQNLQVIFVRVISDLTYIFYTGISL